MRCILVLFLIFQSLETIGQEYIVIVDQNRNRLIDDVDMALMHPEDIYQLNLSGKGYNSIPDVIGNFPNLEYLDLSNNKITIADLDILGLCPHLKFLYLDNNLISEFPIEIFDELPYLEVLNLGFNDISEIRYDLKSDRLVSLNIHHNQITEITGKWAFKALHELRLNSNKLTNNGLNLSVTGRLEAVNLNDNQFDEIPSILVEMKHLKRLDLGNNRLNRIHEIKRLRKLELLILDDNPITAPSNALENILSLRKLKVLSFERNGVSTLPAIPEKSRIEEFSLIGNQINSIPFEVEKAKKLKKLWLSGNPLKERHIDILSRKYDKTIIIF